MVDAMSRVSLALEKIVKNKDKKALNYAVDYAIHALKMIEEGASKEELRVQLLYVRENISYWRGDEAVVVRGVLGQAIKAWE